MGVLHGVEEGGRVVGQIGGVAGQIGGAGKEVGLEGLDVGLDEGEGGEEGCDLGLGWGLGSEHQVPNVSKFNIGYSMMEFKSCGIRQKNPSHLMLHAIPRIFSGYFFLTSFAPLFLNRSSFAFSLTISRSLF